jgi:16S rRNA (guanine966-N2)-methyltransferase
MTRVIAGVARGRRLRVPPSGTRPTSDRTREGLFSSIESALGTLAGRRVLDLYAGSGAVGAEALSRGAVEALLVESDRAAAEVARANLDVVGLPGGSVSRTSVEALAGTVAPGRAYDLVFADPPYSLPADELRAVLADLLAHGWIGPTTLVVVERATRDDPWQWPPGIRGDRERRYGEGTLWYGRAAEVPV